MSAVTTCDLDAVKTRLKNFHDQTTPGVCADRALGTRMAQI